MTKKSTWTPRAQTDRSEDAPDFLQHALHVGHRAENQGAHHDVHRLVLHRLHVLPGGHDERAVRQMRVRVHAHPQVLLEMRVGVGAGHRAAVRVEPEVGPAAAADLQQAKSAVVVGKCGHVSEKLPLRFVHFSVVGKRDVVRKQGKHALVQTAQARDFQQVQR